MKPPLKVVIFFSGSASSMRYLLENDPNCGKAYRFVGAFCDRSDASGIEAASRAGVPTAILNFKIWCDERGIDRKDFNARPDYFKEVVKILKPFKPDVLMFSGFMLVITDPLLTEYRGRILNVHPADLRITDEQGRRKYIGPGDRVVREQIADGLKETRSSVHIVTREIDGGPIVAVSDPLAVEPRRDAAAHQEKMKFACDGPAYQKAFELITDGRFELWTN